MQMEETPQMQQELARYPLTDVQRDDLRKRFTYHPPKPDQPERYQAIREAAHQLATLIVQSVPTGREQASALTNLELASFWANAGIARNE